MPDTNEGVLDSTTSDSEDITLLEQEDIETPESEHSEFPAPKEEKAPVKEEGEEEKDEEEKPRAEGEREEEEEDKEKAKSSPPYERPSMQQLREAFPDLFKKFPSLRDIYYREQEFSQIYSTVEEAREASTAASSFDALANKALGGDTEGLLGAIKEADPNAFNKIASTALNAIYKLSPDAHWQATLPLLQNLVRGFYMEGERRNNENVKNAAEYLSDFVFGDIAIAQGKRNLIPPPPSAEASAERRQLEADKAQFALNRFQGFSISVKNSANEQIKAFVDQKKYVDPDNVFSDFIRETIVGRTLQEVDNQLAADKAHMKYMYSLWEKAKNEGFGDEWKSRITSAYLARAKSLVPAIRAKLVSEAQGTSTRAAERRNERSERNASRREPGSGGRTSSERRNGPIDARDVDWNKTSDLDLLDDRITYKK